MGIPKKKLSGDRLKLFARRVLLILLAIDVSLAVVYLLTFESGSDYLALAFHLDIEGNVPTTYSAVQLIIAGCLVLACAWVDRERRFRWSIFGYWQVWLMVGGLLILMGLDEYMARHEGFGKVKLVEWGIIPEGGNTIAGYAWPWTVFGAAFTILVGIPAALAVRRLLSGHRDLFRLLFLAGSIYVLGALGFENLRVFTINYHDGIFANVLMIMEEVCEMVGVSLIVYVFLRYLGERLSAGKSEQVSYARAAGSTESTV